MGGRGKKERHLGPSGGVGPGERPRGRRGGPAAEGSRGGGGPGGVVGEGVLGHQE